MAESKTERLDKVHARAMARFDRCYSSQQQIRLMCVRDRRFVFVEGAQFEGDMEQQFQNRPRFEINKMQQSVIRLISEYRNNRVTVDFRPADDATSDDDAEFLDGLYRADEQDSGAQEAYDTAFSEGVSGGMGAWRLVNRYDDEEDEESDRRRICIEPIPDADNSVFFDIDAKRYDKADATYGFVISGMQQPDYSDLVGEDLTAVGRDWSARRAIYKAKNLTSFDMVTRMGIFDWYAPDIVYVAEYYEVERITSPINYYASPTGEEVTLRPKSFDKKEEFEAAEALLVSQGFTLQRVAKKVKEKRVHKYLIDGMRVIEDCGYVAGKHIPIVPFYANRNFVDNIERISGHVRVAIDLQRLYNMILSMLAELTTYTWVEKPILTPAQVAGHEVTWATDPVQRFPYQLLNGTPDEAGNEVIPPIQYTKAPQIPPALAALVQMIGGDMQEVLGTAKTAEEVRSNISAKAVELIQTRLDMQNFLYMDNYKQSMKRCGEIWLDMNRELRNEDEMSVRVVNEDGTDDVVKMRVKTVKDGKDVYQNDPTTGKFKVVADVGPSFTTRRDGTVRAITGMLQFAQDPQERAVLTAVAMTNLDGEGLKPAKKYFRDKLLQMGLEKPNEEEAAEMAAAQQNQQPSAQDQFLLAEAEKSRALADKARADAVEAAAKAQETLANIEKIQSSLKTENLDRILKLLEAARGEQPATTA